MASTLQQLDIKLTNLQRKIKQWATSQTGNIKDQIHTCRDYLAWFDKVKAATQQEKFIAAILKRRHTELSVLEETIWWQRARVKWELPGDRGTSYFHSIASNSKRRNTIQQVQRDNGTYSDHATKAKVFYDFFINLMGTIAPTMPQIRWTNLYPNQIDLNDLANPIAEAKIKEAIA